MRDVLINVLLVLACADLVVVGIMAASLVRIFAGF